ncbi:vesicle coat component [Clavispora lusitaniae]|nr:vesicle coat component [Clavispora lusitaniae]
MTSNVIPPTGIPHLIEFSTLKVLGKSPLVSAQALAEFQSLVMRLSETSSSESGWLGSKLSKVNLDKVWGQLDKFIGGEEGAAKPAEKGVFSKFSPSLSRNTSALDITQIPIPHSQQRQEGSFLAESAAAAELAAEPEHRPHEQPNEDVPTQMEEPMQITKEDSKKDPFQIIENVPQSVNKEQQIQRSKEPKKHKEASQLHHQRRAPLSKQPYAWRIQNSE